MLESGWGESALSRDDHNFPKYADKIIALMRQYDLYRLDR